MRGVRGRKIAAALREKGAGTERRRYYMQNAQLDSDRIKILIAEYRTSKASAENQIFLIWQAASIIWGANMVLIGLVVTAIDKPSTLKLVPAISVFGIMTSIAWIVFTSFYRSIFLHEYKRCIEIEDELRMNQHSFVPSRKLQFAYLFMTALLISAWLFILIHSLTG